MNDAKISDHRVGSHIMELETIDRPLFSVVTVTRNLISQGREDTFRTALTCVQNQTFRDVEHIVLDGASDDGTQNMIEEIIGQYTKTCDAIQIRYQSAPDQGLYDAMNRAVDIAKGEYVLFLNSDDTLAGPEVLAMAADIVSSLSPDFVYGAAIEVGANGEKRELARTNLAAFLQRMPFCHNSMIVQKSVFQELRGHDLEYPVAADYDFVFRMLVTGHTGVCAQFPISVFSTRGVSSDAIAVADDYARVWERFFSDLESRVHWSRADCVGWYRVGQMPFSACWFAFQKGRTVPQLRRAALHSAKITLRRRLQPWRRWDYLKPQP